MPNTSLVYEGLGFGACGSHFLFSYLGFRVQGCCKVLGLGFSGGAVALMSAQLWDDLIGHLQAALSAAVNLRVAAAGGTASASDVTPAIQPATFLP